jgi:hypothetical protein
MNSLERNAVLSIAKSLYENAEALKAKYPGSEFAKKCGRMTGTDVLAHDTADMLREVASALRLIAEGQ